MMERRNLLFSALAVCAAPIAFVKASTVAVSSSVRDRFPIKACREPGSNWIDAFYTDEDVEKRHPSEPPKEFVDLHDSSAWPEYEVFESEYVATSRWLVYCVPTTKVSEMKGPLDVPNHFGTYGWSHDTITLPLSEEGLTKEDAIRKTAELNRRHMATRADQWAVAIELAEPQGYCSYSLECGPEALSMVQVTKFLPARIYRDGMGS